LNFLRRGDPKLCALAKLTNDQFVVLQINYDVIKPQKYQL